jgi:hypothetical protein
VKPLFGKFMNRGCRALSKRVTNICRTTRTRKEGKLLKEEGQIGMLLVTLLTMFTCYYLFLVYLQTLVVA